MKPLFSGVLGNFWFFFSSRSPVMERSHPGMARIEALGAGCLAKAAFQGSVSRQCFKTVFKAETKFERLSITFKYFEF